MVESVPRSASLRSASLRSVVERTLNAVGREVGGAVRALPSGRCSDAWLVDTDSGEWVVRVPIADSGRRESYRSEALVGRHLAERGHPVAEWVVVEIDGVECSVAPRLPGDQVNYDARWTEPFARSLGELLTDLHRLPVTGFGPLRNTSVELAGTSTDRWSGIVDRWFHASVWPFDGSSLADHEVASAMPGVLAQVEAFRPEIEHAEAGPIGVAHSDLHREHLLVGSEGRLTGLLDFGDAFVGATAWDFALLLWYYGGANAALVASHYPDGDAVLHRARYLSIAVGLYKMAKTPTDQNIAPRLRRCLQTLSGIDG